MWWAFLFPLWLSHFQSLPVNISGWLKDVLLAQTRSANSGQQHCQLSKEFAIFTDSAEECIALCFMPRQPTSGSKTAAFSRTAPSWWHYYVPVKLWGENRNSPGKKIIYSHRCYLKFNSFSWINVSWFFYLPFPNIWSGCFDSCMAIFWGWDLPASYTMPLLEVLVF